MGIHSESTFCVVEYRAAGGGGVGRYNISKNWPSPIHSQWKEKVLKEFFILVWQKENTMQSYESARLGEKENLARKTSCKTDLIDDDANLDEMPAEKKTRQRTNWFPEILMVQKQMFSNKHLNSLQTEKQQNKQRGEFVSKSNDDSPCKGNWKMQLWQFVWHCDFGEPESSYSPHQADPRFQNRFTFGAFSWNLQLWLQTVVPWWTW